MALLEARETGLYCPAGDFHIDPALPVDRALITHAHSDHARPGSRAYLTARPGEALLRARIGDDAAIQSEPYGASIRIGEVSVSFHPAGHILGSSQIRIELAGEVWVVSGDYKLAPDPTCAPFEPLRCHTFVTESTFGLPIFRWSDAAQTVAEIQQWWHDNRQSGRASILFAYPVGKAQRILSALDATAGPLVFHEPVERVNAIYRAQGIALPLSADDFRLLRSADPGLAQPPGLALAAPFRPRVHRLRLRLDAHSRAAPPPLAGPRLRALRSRRLARPPPGHRAVRRRDRLGHARLHRAAGPLVAGARQAGRPRGVGVAHGFRRAATARTGGPSRMKAFAELYAALDQTTKTNGKVEALKRYLAAAQPEDAAWAVNFLIGRRPKRLLESRKLAQWAIDEAGVPDWLFGECYHAVGDFAETIALLLPPAAASSALPLHYWIEERLLPLRDADDETRRRRLVQAWRELDEGQRFAWNKLITGEFRVGVSQSLVVRAIAETSGIAPEVMAHRLMGEWQPTAEFWRQLVAPDTRDADISRPYPFCLAYPVEGDVADLGDPAEWQIEWKWDGIRAQLIRRQWRTFLWSRGEELITDRFPELEALGAQLPEGTVIDGEVLPWKDGAPLPFAQMQRRIGRKVLGPKILSEVPVVLVAYDLLELNGEDIRERPLEWRRASLQALAPPASALVLSPIVSEPTWDALRQLREQSRARKVEGFMLKRLGSPYRVGRRRGDWWKWKINPYSVDCVLIYAQPGNGRRASLFTDYTFGVWDDGKLVPFAKAYSGLTDEEIREVDAFVRRNTLEKFGPVHAVKPELVFELAFEAIQRSPRHRSGIAVRFPRMARWRRDKKAEDADTLDTIRSLLA